VDSGPDGPGVLVDGESFGGALLVTFGGRAVAAGGLDAVVEDLGDKDDAFPVADHGRARVVAQGGHGGAGRAGIVAIFFWSS
jgi:hypothetical protein